VNSSSKDKKKIKDLLRLDQFRIYEPTEENPVSMDTGFSVKIDEVNWSGLAHFISKRSDKANPVFFIGGISNSIFRLIPYHYNDDQCMIQYLSGSNRSYTKSDIALFIEFLTKGRSSET
jgi:hypothetical protein